MLNFDKNGYLKGKFSFKLVLLVSSSYKSVQEGFLRQKVRFRFSLLFGGHLVTSN